MKKAYIYMNYPNVVVLNVYLDVIKEALVRIGYDCEYIKDLEGISKKDLPFIFERFYRASKSNTDSVGIGLAMSYSILTNQDATIHVKSKVNVGTQFSIRFYK